MAEISSSAARAMGASEIAEQFERAAKMQQEHQAITYEHGVSLVNIVGAHGSKIADLMRDGLKYRASMRGHE